MFLISFIVFSLSFGYKVMLDSQNVVENVLSSYISLNSLVNIGIVNSSNIC